MRRSGAFAWAATTSLLASSAAWVRAEAAPGPDAVELAGKSENPIERLLKLPVQQNFQFGLGAYDRVESLLKFEPVIPIPLSGSWAIVTRTIIPVQYEPDTSASSGGSTGLGDVSPTLFVSPGHSERFHWGVGPDFQLPTATTSATGSGKWSVGPSAAFVFKPKPWVLGAIASNIWSFAGDSSRPAVNTLSVEYFVHYNFSNGWTLSTAPTMTPNWNASSGDVWTIPVGGGVGRVFEVSGLAIHPTLQAYDYVKRPSDGAAWELRLEVSFRRAE